MLVSSIIYFPIAIYSTASGAIPNSVYPELIEYISSNGLTNTYSINIPLLKIPNNELKDWDKYKLFLNKHDWFNIIDGSDHD